MHPAAVISAIGGLLMAIGVGGFFRYYTDPPKTPKQETLKQFAIGLAIVGTVVFVCGAAALFVLTS